jgi:hypothetical protein
MTILADFNAKVGKEVILKPTIMNEKLHEILIDNEIIAVNFMIFKNAKFQNHIINEFSFTFLNGMSRNPSNHILALR